MQQEIIKKSICRVCKGKSLTKVFNFGPTPLANAFLTEKQIDLPEKYYPLIVNFCNICSFLQLGHAVSSKTLFDDYVYVSSTSTVFIKHFEDFAKDISVRFNLVSRLNLGKESLVIDLGSNDGILLKPFKKLGTRVLGIEPSKHIAELAENDGIPTVSEYFNREVAKDIVKKYGRAKIVTATNVFAHIDDLDEIIKGIKIILDDDGVFIVESPYMVDFIEKRYFDLVYHEHMSYWRIATLAKIFDRLDMRIFAVEKVTVHGGSVRVFVKKKSTKRKVEKSVADFLKKEEQKKLDSVKTYMDFAKKVQENKIALLRMLGKLKMKGKRIAGYGAPAKGNTLVNYFSIGQDILDFIVDDSPMKQGLYSPGKHIPVVSSKAIYKEKPDYLLVLAWNFADAIMNMHEPYKKQGGKFIIPVPKPRVI